jgi:hypothetical protein
MPLYGFVSWQEAVGRAGSPADRREPAHRRPGAPAGDRDAGRLDDLQASGQLERRLRSGARFAANALVLKAARPIIPPSAGARTTGSRERTGLNCAGFTAPWRGSARHCRRTRNNDRDALRSACRGGSLRMASLGYKDVNAAQRPSPDLVIRGMASNRAKRRLLPVPARRTLCSILSEEA